MAASDVTAVFTTILKTGSAIRDLVNTGYKVSADFRDFQRKIDQLVGEKSFWETQIVKFGLSDDTELLSSFLRAETLLTTEETQLRSRIATIDESWIWPRLKMVLFPSKLEQTIVRVSRIFDVALGDLKRKKEIAKECQERVGVMKASLSFRADHRYIPFKETEEKVMTVLRSADRPAHALILLHGLSGSGKTSLVRNVALQVDEAIQKRERQKIQEIAQKSKSNPAGDYPPGTSKSTTDPLKSTSLVFDQVVYLECGPRVDLRAKQLDLREKLGSNPAKLGTSEGNTGGQSESNAMIKNSVSRLLKERSLLIILDDVLNLNFETNVPRSHFLQNMIDLGGSNVKWLVRSQSEYLCEGLNLNLKFHCIEMENIKPDVARQILAVHIGGPRENISSEVQQLMDKIIRKVEANPLAMTCIAPAIDRKRFDDEAEWAAVLEDMASHLKRSAHISIQSKEYEHSCCWEAIELGFGRLTKQHQNLLILMAMCKGPSVPEEVVQFLYKESRDPNAFQSFSEARRDLQGRHLVRIAIASDGEGRKGRKGIKAWSIHGLIKEFIAKKYLFPRDDETSLFQRLCERNIMFKFDSEIQSQVMSTVAALYFDIEFRKEFRPDSSLDIMADTLSDERRRVIEPITRLLVLSEGDKWTSTLHSSTRKVFLDYLRGGQFDEESTSTLLHSGQSAVPMIEALMQFSDTNEYSFVGQRIISSLVELLEKTTTLDTIRRQELDFQLLYHVSRVIGELAHGDVHNRSVQVLVEAGSFVKAFTQLANLLTSANLDQDSRTQGQVVDAIVYLTYSCSRITVELGNVPGLHEGLVKVFFQSDNHNHQADALVALANLAYDSDNFKVKLVDITGMLERLVEALMIDCHHRLQTEAARVFSILALNDYTALKVVDCPDALGALLDGLGRDTKNHLQEWCADVLQILADCFDDMRGRLVRFPMLVEKLVNVLGKEYISNSTLKFNAGMALGHLAEEDGQTRSQMLNSHDLIEKLVDAASKDNNDGSAIYALTCLFPERGKEIKLRSTKAHARRGEAEAIFGHYQEALEDLNETCRMGPPNASTFSWSCYVKVKMRDFKGALADANSAVEMEHNCFTLLARGVLKRMMGDLPGALSDLDQSLERVRGLTWAEYHILKHLGFVKFLNGDEAGARRDAESAITFQPRSVHDCRYGNYGLREYSVEYLKYQLR